MQDAAAPPKVTGARSIGQAILLWVISTNGRWVQARQLRPQLRKVRSGVARGTTADPMITGFWRRSQDAAATPYSEAGAVDFPMAYHLASTLGGDCPRAGRRRHGDEGDAGRVQALCAAGERRCAAPANGPFPPLQGISKDLGFDGLDEANTSPPSTSFLNASDSLLHASDSRVCRGPLVSFASAG